MSYEIYTIRLTKSNLKRLDELSRLLNLSRSQTLLFILKYVLNNQIEIKKFKSLELLDVVISVSDRDNLIRNIVKYFKNTKNLKTSDVINSSILYSYENKEKLIEFINTIL